MKKLLLVGLMMLAGSAWAKWVMYDRNESMTYYFDPSTVRKDGNMRRVWELQNFTKRDNDGVMSLRSRQEYDCKQERYRFLSGSTHTETMAGGEVLGTAGEDNDWTAIPPGAAVEIILKIVCAK